MPDFSVADFERNLRASAALSTSQWANVNLDEFKDARHLAKWLVERKLLTEWQANVLLSGKSHLRLGNRLLLNLIDHNDLGECYLARQESLDRLVEVQMLPKEFNRHSLQFESFIDSAKMLTKVDHPNLAHVYDVGEDNRRFFVVQEHAPGQTLEQLDYSKLQPSEAISIIKELTSVVSFLHDQKVCHGSLKKQNVSINKSGHCQIVGLIGRILNERVLGKRDELATEREASQFGLIDRVALQGIAGELMDRVFGKNSDPEMMSAIVQLGQGPEALKRLQTVAANWQNSPRSNPPHGESLQNAKITPPFSPKRSVSPQSNIAQERSPKPFIFWVSVGVASTVFVAGLFGAIGFWSGWFDRTTTQVSKRPGQEHPSTFERKDQRISKDEKSRVTSKTKVNSDVVQPSIEIKRKQDESAFVANPNPVIASPANLDIVEVKPGLKDTTSLEKSTTTIDVSKGQSKTQHSIDPFSIPATPNSSIEIKQESAETPKSAQQKAETSNSNGKKGTGDPANDKSVAPKQDAFNASGTAALFSKVNAIFDLVPTGVSSEPQVLGEITLPDGAELTLDLISNGELCGKGKNFFSIASAGSNPEWTVKLSKNQDGTEADKIGQFSLADNKLKFEWAKDLDAKSNANFLANSILNITAAGETKLIVLRKPVTIDTLFIDEKDFSKKVNIEIPWLPASEGIKIQFGNFDPGLWGKAVVENPGMANKLPATIRFSGIATEQVFWLALMAESKSRIECRLEVQTQDGTGLKSLRPRELDDIIAALSARFEQLIRENDVAQIAAQNAPTGQKTKTKDFAKETRARMEAAQQFKLLAQEQAGTIKNLLKVVIPIRIVYEFDGQSIELARATTFSNEPMAQPEPDDQKK